MLKLISCRRLPIIRILQIQAMPFFPVYIYSIKEKYVSQCSLSSINRNVPTTQCKDRDLVTLIGFAPSTLTQEETPNTLRRYHCHGVQIKQLNATYSFTQSPSDCNHYKTSVRPKMANIMISKLQLEKYQITFGGEGCRVASGFTLTLHFVAKEGVK